MRKMQQKSECGNTCMRLKRTTIKEIDNGNVKHDNNNKKNQYGEQERKLKSWKDSGNKIVKGLKNRNKY